MRIPQFLKDQEVAFETIVHPPVYSSQRRAQLLRIPGRSLLKSVVLKSRNLYFLAVLPATHHIQWPLLENHLGHPVFLARNEEVAEIFRDCEWGVRTPFGRLYGIPTWLEETVHKRRAIAFEAHFHHLTIRMNGHDFEHLERPEQLHFSQPVLSRNSHYQRNREG